MKRLQSISNNLMTIIFLMCVYFFLKYIYIGIIPDYGYTEEFSWEAYALKCKEFVQAFWTNKSLGTTNAGNSFESEIGYFFTRSLRVIVSALFLSIALGIWKGIFDYRNRNNPLNLVGNGTTWFLSSAPDFMLIFWLQWFVLLYLPAIKGYWFSTDEWYGFILPSILVAIYPMMYIARITSTALGNEDGQLYVQVARSKGFTIKYVLSKHIWRNCVGTVFLYLPSVMGYIVTNLLIVEYMLDYKGAVFRLFAVFSPTRYFSSGGLEPGIVVGFSFCFILLMFLAEIISIAIQFQTKPERNWFDFLRKVGRTLLLYPLSLVAITLVVLYISL